MGVEANQFTVLPCSAVPGAFYDRTFVLSFLGAFLGSNSPILSPPCPHAREARAGGVVSKVEYSNANSQGKYFDNRIENSTVKGQQKKEPPGIIDNVLSSRIPTLQRQRVCPTPSLLTLGIF